MTDILDIEPEPNPAALTIDKMRGVVRRLEEASELQGSEEDRFKAMWGGIDIPMIFFRVNRAAFRRRFIRRYRRASTC